MLELVIGVVIGAVLGLTGAGGSMFAVPLLMIGLSQSPNQATGLALGAVAASAGWGVLQRLRAAEVVWFPATMLAITGAIFAPMGRWLAQDVHPLGLLAGFSLLVAVVALRMWRQAVLSPQQSAVLRAGGTGPALDQRPVCQLGLSGQLELRPRCLYCMLLGGVLAGLLSGFFGVGGGFVVVPLLILLVQVSMRQAVGTSLLVIAIVSSSGFAAYWLLGNRVPGTLLGLLMVGGLIGMMLGSFLARYVGGPGLQKLFALTMVALTGLSWLVQMEWI